MNDLDPRDPLEQLRAANPFSTHTPTPQPKRTADALFKEITMSTDTDTDTDTAATTAPHPITSDSASFPPVSDTGAAGSASSPRRRWRPSIALPAAAAVGALIVGGAIVLQPGDSPSAHALVNEAAETSADFDSGHAVVEIDITTVPGESSNGRVTFDYRYDGGDFSFYYDQSEFNMDLGQYEDAGDDVVVARGAIEIRGVGDQLYSSFDDPTGFIVSPRSSDAESTEALFGLNPESIEPSTVVGLVERAEDFEQVTSADGVTSYAGTVSVADLEAIGADALPAGISLLADGETNADDLPGTIGVEVTVNDGLLERVTIDIDGDTPTGYAKATITTTFSEYGEAQNIAAPPADQVTDQASLLGDLPEGFDDALAVLDELDARRPELCNEVFGGDDADPSTAEVTAAIAAFPVCLEAAGEQAAADAFRTISDLPGS